MGGVGGRGRREGDEFKRKVNAVPFRLSRLIDKVYYELID